MSKIKIKLELKSKTTNHVFEGEAIKNGLNIIFNDHDIITKISLSDIIYLERKKDYYMKIGFCNSKTINGTYIIPEGNMKISTETKELVRSKNKIKIKYILKINDNYIDDFELNFQYGIDTQT